MGNLWFFKHCIYEYMAQWHSAEQYLCEINIAKKRCATEHFTQHSMMPVTRVMAHNMQHIPASLCKYWLLFLRLSHQSFCLLCLQTWSSPSVCRFLPTFAPETSWGTTPSLQVGAPSISVSVKTGMLHSTTLHSVWCFIPHSCIVSSYRWPIQLKATATADPCVDSDTV
jgi:hypothetical protein